MPPLTTSEGGSTNNWSASHLQQPWLQASQQIRPASAAAPEAMHTVLQGPFHHDHIQNNCEDEGSDSDDCAEDEEEDEYEDD